MKNQKAHKVQTSKVLGPNGEVIPETLDDIIKQIKKAVLDRNYVPGSKAYQTNLPIVKAYLQSSCLCTIELIKRGKEEGGLDEDKYNLLTAKTKVFGTKNDHVNEILTELAEERAQDVKNMVELEMDDNPENPLSDEEQAKLIAEPTADPDTHKVHITTKDGGEMVFNKQSGEITVKNEDGTVQTATMSKLESWRKTAMAWLTVFFKRIKDSVTDAKDTVVNLLQKINPFKKPEGVHLDVTVGPDGTIYYDPNTLPDGSVPPRGAVPYPSV